MLNSQLRSIAQRTIAAALLGPPLLMMAAIVAPINACLGIPVFFKQKRIGQNGKEFDIWKFQSMRTGNAEDSERLTGLGKILRKGSLDELPQLFNILSGDMDLVGWRPLVRSYRDIWNEHTKLNIDKDAAELESVREAIELIAQTKPGAFGPIQISALRGTYESGDHKNFQNIVEIEAAYVSGREKKSTLHACLQDFNILARVPRALIKSPGHVARTKHPAQANDNDTAPESKNDIVNAMSL